MISPKYRAALQVALAGKGSANEAIAMIETSFAAAPACSHCGSESFGTWGHASGLCRYKCRNCHRTFNALTGTPLARLHRRDAWLDYARALVDRVSLRKAAERADVCLEPRSAGAIASSELPRTSGQPPASSRPTRRSS
ncbi:MAG: hypothetical protein ABL907_05290 [Hyphomicrobium sp.]